MYRHLVVACYCLLLITAPARASLELSLEGLPTVYEPNTSFSFDVRLAGAENLNSFFIVLDMNAALGTAGVDFFFLEASEPASGYVFEGASSVGFEATASVINNTARIALSDFLIAGEVETVPGVNDLIATVTATTTGDVGALSIGFNTDPFLLDLVDEDFGDIPGFGDLVSALEAAGPVSLSPAATDTMIPEPSTLAIFLLGGGVAMFASFRRGRSRNRTRSASQAA